jgi:hypothetical protein
MKRISLPLLIAALALVAFTACGLLPGSGGDGDGADAEAEAVELTAQAFAADSQAADQTATADVIAAADTATAEAATAQAIEEAPPTETITPTVPPPTATETPSEFQLTLAAAGTQQAPTIAAGQTLAAETAIAVPTATPLTYNIITTTTTETITEDDVEITVTAVVPPDKTLSQAWSEVYASPAGLPFTITTDEDSMEAAIEASLAAAGHGENISDLEVRLNNSLITLEFTITIGAAGADGRISFSAFAQNGQVIITMTSLQFGRFTVPDDMLAAINVAIAQALTGASDTTEAQVTINELIIDDGQMAISGIVGIE